MSKVKNKAEKLVIVSDIDGVVAEFTYNACLLMNQIFGKPEKPIKTDQMPTWGFGCFGLSEKDEDVFWEHVSNSDHYWLNQQEMYPGIVKGFNELQDTTTAVYWCTNKSHTRGATAEVQTYLWLQKYGFANPCVVVSNDKGNFCKSVAADMFIDDKASNVLEVLDKSPETECYFLVHPYGKQYEDELSSKGAVIITNTKEFVEAVKIKKAFVPLLKQISMCCK
jgi:hypothetical protein